MKIQNDIVLSDKVKRLLIAVSSFLMLNLSIFIIDPYNNYWTEYFTRNIFELCGDLLLSFLFCLIVSEVSIIISKKLNSRISWSDYPGKRFALEIALNLINIFILILAIDLFYQLIIGESQSTFNNYQLLTEEKRSYIQWIFVSLVIGLITVGLNMVNYLSLSWKKTSIRATELDQIATLAELEALKLQIDPHFVFNNLSILSELILKSQQLGYEYAENFSKIYRYMLINSKKDVIRLEEELKFLNSYIFLVNHRFNEGINFIIDVDEQSRQKFVPPLILQILAENAIKHNKTSKKSPLHIRIYNIDENELIVENTYMPIGLKPDSVGIGIHNIIRRYGLLSEKTPEIIKGPDFFKVIIPLLNYDKDNTYN